MNPIIANIYGTSGFEKTASAESGLPENLHDLALMIAVEQEGDDNLEKVASVQTGYFEELLAYDRAGRALAHQEFADMEKEAAAGNSEPIRAFFSDVIDQSNEQSDASELKDAIAAELARRQS
tara:strand:+ start:134 stop:502 length:369 start_codon:yes stop_codon:yes gene_type:complete